MATSQEGSTNNTQEENNIKDLGGKAAIEKLRSLAEKAESCFFCTNIKTGVPLSVRPMAIQQVDDEGNIWFMSMKDSHKNDEISSDPFTHLLFQAGAHSGFVNIYGISEIIRDQAKIDELWSPFIKTWFQGGKDDPDITLIKVIPSEGYYWDTKHGTAVAFLKMAVSVITGKTMDDSVEGTLEVD
ncbi:pyridoxamine 5'-phosphate oxidase family protein [Pedobacter kyonggii]|uniref:General stress protein n=1 Tax=Pedobacter kyonggii TaxID=1926871 RepID=A0A4Q9HA23_9SPHI|nr:pyridoxamine 5'-phosphate oxidase family protein [Pedobacter kyonggii]TBO40647.1 general stress protein [Pedobacter kyonggii]